jgi:hypothetical protein
VGVKKKSTVCTSLVQGVVRISDEEEVGIQTAGSSHGFVMPDHRSMVLFNPDNRFNPVASVLGHS